MVEFLLGRNDRGIEFNDHPCFRRQLGNHVLFKSANHASKKHIHTYTCVVSSKTVVIIYSRTYAKRLRNLDKTWLNLCKHEFSQLSLLPQKMMPSSKGVKKLKNNHFDLLF